VSPEEFRSQLTLVSSDSWPQFIGAADGRACLQCESLFELPAIITRKPALVVLWTDLSELTPQERAMLERGRLPSTAAAARADLIEGGIGRERPGGQWREEQS